MCDSKKMTEINRRSPFESKQSVPFLYQGVTVSDVVKLPLSLDGQPYDYFEYSPTPLDPMLLRDATGSRYDEAALEYMDDMRERVSQDFTSFEDVMAWYDANVDNIPDPLWLSVMRETMTQHALKLKRNDNAIRTLRDNKTRVTPSEAEDIMRVRAGVAPLPTMLRFLARYPEIGGLEILKATRPFDAKATGRAYGDLLSELYAMEGDGDLDLSVKVKVGRPRRLKIVPDSELNDVPDPRIVILKTRLAKVAVRLSKDEVQNLEIIWRDSGALLDETHKNPATIYMVGKDRAGHEAAHIAPISVTAYARLVNGN